MPLLKGKSHRGAILLAAALFLTLQLSSPLHATALDDMAAGQSAAKEGRLEEALSYFERAILSGELRGNDLARAYNNRGNIHGMMGNPRRSLQDLNQALLLDPEYASAYYNRAITYQDLGNLESALADYDQVLRLIPDSVTALFFRGVTYEALGYRAEAKKDYLRAYELAPEDPLVTQKIEALGLK